VSGTTVFPAAALRGCAAAGGDEESVARTSTAGARRIGKGERETPLARRRSEAIGTGSAASARAACAVQCTDISPSSARVSWGFLPQSGLFWWGWNGRRGELGEDGGWGFGAWRGAERVDRPHPNEWMPEKIIILEPALKKGLQNPPKSSVFNKNRSDFIGSRKNKPAYCSKTIFVQFF
jgi:hypothetical protein